ncbi:hypothetical protein S7711_10111 [Stachybotrys chartarum IBT 7711]|uniref:Uncharacterized protein n=1 Tax=Stachybotrys chartarum (strain CBS 109288 / IBT 7711) TaxID=1280523 RepID=A0A084AXM0_STACB|nr:hypothetical protein S7711_10111 [Stachybotrys chartarum IBT 7711]
MAEFWNDFYNNFATDIAPIITLFGEQPTKQFLSESTTIWDAIALAVLPLGILTIVVSAIRVSDIGFLKSFVGRAQEPEGAAEVELCSSTSDSVCELWGGRGITRIFGRPKILEFVCQYEHATRGLSVSRASGDSERSSGFSAASASDSPDRSLSPDQALLSSVPIFNIFPMDRFLETECRKGRWSEIHGHAWYRIGVASHAEEAQRFAPKPNLTLNIGIRDKSPAYAAFAAACGIALAINWIGFSAWVTFNGELKTDASIITLLPVVFALLIFSSLASWIGLGICAYLINRASEERRFAKLMQATDDHAPGTTTNTAVQSTEYGFWLQPGSQAVGDQVFDVFAYQQPLTSYTTSFKYAGEPQKTIFYLGVGSSLIGWALQFFCLRSLHAFVSMYLLGATLIMAILRAVLRARRFSPKDNILWERWKSKILEGHELDWQALKLEELARSIAQSSSMIRPDLFVEGGYDEPYVPAFSVCDEYHLHGAMCCSGNSRDIEECTIHSAPASQGYHLTTLTPWIQSNVGLDDVKTAIMKDQYGQINAAARAFQYRSQLARLAASSPFESERWDPRARENAKILQRAIESTADFILSRRLRLWVRSDEIWLSADSLMWTFGCRFAQESRELVQDQRPQNICVVLRRRNGRWRVDLDDLEAILGLWTWSIVAITEEARLSHVSTAVFNNMDMDLESGRRLAFTASSEMEAQGLEKFLALWLPPTVTPSLVHKETEILDDDGLRSLEEHNLGYKWLVDAREYENVNPNETEHSTHGNYKITIPFVTNDLFKQRAQLLYTSFLRQMSSIIEPLYVAEMVEQVEMSSHRLCEISQSSLFRLSNTEIEAMVQIFVDSGLGEQDDAFSSIIPVLVAGTTATIYYAIPWMRSGRPVRLARAWAGIYRRTMAVHLDHFASLDLERIRSAYDVEMTPDVRHFGKYLSENRELFSGNMSEPAHVICENYPQVFGAAWMRNTTLNTAPWDLEHPSALDKYPFALHVVMSWKRPGKPNMELDQNDYCEKLLEWACKEDCPEVFEDIHLSSNLKAIAKRMPVMKIAISAESIATIEAILQQDLWMDKHLLNHLSWLREAVSQGKPEVVQVLLRSPNVRRHFIESDQISDLIGLLAPKGFNTEIFTLLFRHHPASVQYALKYAVKNQSLVVLRYALQYGRLKLGRGVGIDESWRDELEYAQVLEWNEGVEILKGV